MNLDVDGIPVVEAGAAELGVGDLEAEGFDEMEAGAGGGAEARDVAGVGGNFGVDEDDIERDGRPAEIEYGLAGVGVLHGGRIGRGGGLGKRIEWNFGLRPGRGWPDAGGMEKRIRILRDVLAAGLLAGLVFLAFGGAVRCGFVHFDDNIYVFENWHVRQGLTGRGCAGRSRRGTPPTGIR
jgi:hypothetical protein